MNKIKKYLIAFSAFSILIVPSLSLAATAAELQAQINALMQQISQLQQQLAQLQGGSTQWCYTFNINLKFGDQGSEVASLQNALEKEGLNVPTDVELGPTSVFNEAMASAVTGFQEKYKSEILTPLGLKYGTGYVGKATRAKLNKLYGCGVTPPISCQNLWWFDNTNKVCQQKSFCGAYMYYGLRTFSTLSDCQAALGQSATAPFITSVSPTYGTANDMITIYGKNLINTDPSGNTNPSGIYIEFLRNGVRTGTINGPIYTQSDGLSLKFQLSGIFVANGQLGTYQIRAVNANGTSNTAEFTIMEPLTPSITVLSPNGGESWQIMSIHQIQWQSTIQVTTVQLLKGGVVVESQLNDGPISQGATSFSWQVESDRVVGSDYKIRLIGTANGQQITDDSNAPFSIVAAGTPSITVLSPNGGESLTVGQNYTVRWSSSNVPSGATIFIAYTTDKINFFEIGTVVNTGSYNWTIPNKPGQYNILVNYLLEPGTSGALDYSDAPFSIISGSSASFLRVSTININLSLIKNLSNASGLTFADAFTITNTANSVSGWSLYNNQDGTYAPPGGVATSVIVQGFGFYESSGGIGAGQTSNIRAYVNNNKAPGIYKGSYQLKEIKNGVTTDVTTINYVLDVRDAS